ncbi:porin family protein [Bacteroides reticulotermitis]|uniref:porin family protein n=1 Tax=Bacteroides reticulotermitis TaxID=1133319 RepID=UPI003A8989BA
MKESKKLKIKSLLAAGVLLTGLSTSAMAQIGEQRQNLSVGFNAGANINSVSFTPRIKQNSMTGITGGLTARYISEKYFAMICGVQVELNFSQRGWDELFETLDENNQTVKDPSRSYTRNMTYVDIPFLAHLAFGKDRGVQFFVNAGPQISFLIGESEDINVDMNNLTNTQKEIYDHKIPNKFDYGIAAGGGLELRTRKAGNFLVEGRYYFALSDFVSTTKKDYFSRAAHGTITVKLTYLFDLKK